MLLAETTSSDLRSFSAFGSRETRQRTTLRSRHAVAVSACSFRWVDVTTPLRAKPKSPSSRAKPRVDSSEHSSEEGRRDGPMRTGNGGKASLRKIAKAFRHGKNP